MLLFSVILATIGIGLLEGSEIAMIAVAAASRYKWRKAWLAVLAGLASLIPLLLVIYLFFGVLPVNVAQTLAGVVIFALGAYFFYEGYEKKRHPEEEPEGEHLGIGLMGVYTAILLEELEAGGISMSVAVAAGNAYLSAIIGMLIGLVLPLTVVKGVEPLMEKIPEWAVQLAVGSIMMIVAALIIFLHF